MALTRDWIAQRISGGRNLDHAELAELPTAIGHDPELWRGLVRHDPGRRYSSQLHRDEHLDVWLICWLDQQKTGYHDHDLSSGGVYVCQGTLIEDRFVLTTAGL